MILIIPIFWILFSILTTIMAAKRNRSIFGWFLFSTFFSPLTAWAFLLALGKLESAPVGGAAPVLISSVVESREPLQSSASFKFGQSVAKHRYAVLFSIVFLTLLIRWSFSH